MANLSHVNGPIKEGQRDSKLYPTKPDYVDGLNKKIDEIQENFDSLEDYSLPIAGESSLGGVKLYTNTGNNTDGTITQKIITEELNKKAVIDSPIFTGTPQAVTPDNDTDSTQLATTEFVQNLIRRLVGAAPETLDTLVELATAINNDKNFAETIVQALDNKLNKTDAANTYATKAEIATISGGGVSAGWVQNNFIGNSGTQTLDGDLYITSGKRFATGGNMLYLNNKTHALVLYESGNTAMEFHNLNAGTVTCNYEFKSDGIYLNNTKITN